VSDWREQARCLGMDPNIFHAEGRGSNLVTQRAKRVCAGCPVRDQCLEEALADPTHLGVMGGTTDDERRGMRRGRPQNWRAIVRAEQRTVAAECGTYAGYKRHQRTDGDEPCDACRAAQVAYSRAYNQRRQERRGQVAS